MNINLPKLKELALAAQQKQYDPVALNDYGMAVPPATVLELIAEIERHRLVEAEGCKPEISNLPVGGHTSDAPRWSTPRHAHHRQPSGSEGLHCCGLRCRSDCRGPIRKRRT